MKIWYIIKAGLIGAAIGYFTNWIALRMLFYPQKKIMGIQGLLPKYQGVFAEKAIDFVFNFIDFEDILSEAAKQQVFTLGVEQAPWGAMRKTMGYAVAEEIEHWLSDDYIRKYIAKNLNDLTPQAKVVLARRIANTKLDHLTNLILKSTSREMNFLKALGGILGSFIGIMDEILPW